ncbi:MAG: integrase, partial [Rhizobium sp.]|nr:integrase [Rhizobium sp.]
MSRARKPARLWLRPASKDRAATWIILDGGKQHGTGCSASDREGAERALSEHIARQFIATPPKKGRDASEVSIAEVLAHYLTLKSETATRPKELAARAENLLAYWGDKTLDDITSATCADYAKRRGTPNGARRELEDLRAACRQAIADNVTRQSVTVTLPPKAKGRVKHLDRSTLAKLIWAAYRKRGRYKGAPNKRKPTIHIARFALAAVYTGSRSARVWQASFVKEEGRPYIDLEAGVFYRAWDGERVAANKRAPPIRLPGRLLAH